VSRARAVRCELLWVGAPLLPVPELLDVGTPGDHLAPVGAGDAARFTTSRTSYHVNGMPMGARARSTLGRTAAMGAQ
jgi:hypothetical protein